MGTDVVVLAAGAGRRLHSATAKPLLPLAGRPLIGYVLDAARRLAPRRLVVVCPPDKSFAQAVRALDSKAVCAIQRRPAGTADALRCALPHLAKSGSALVMCADTPLLAAASLRRLQRRAAEKPALLTFTADNPTGYGRIVRGAGNAVRRIVEERDATAAERAIKEVYAGAMALPVKQLADLLARIGRRNAAGERYLTDIAALCAARGDSVATVSCAADDCAGVNTAADLEHLTRLWRQRQAAALLARGARLADAARVDVRGAVRGGRDVEIDINVILEGEVALGRGCRIGAHCIIRDCRIGAGTVIAPYSHLEEATIGARSNIGPYARLRPGSALDSGVHVGNFVEVKNSHLKAGVKAGHLAYLGDSTIGARSNIGAGVITCNYDGKAKHRTHIGSDVFIGSDSQLIAPVKVGRGAYVAAGSTITQPVAANTLALSRSRQTARRRR